MQRQRWYAAKTEPLARATLVDHALLEANGSQWLLAMADTQGGRCAVTLLRAARDRL